MAEYRVEFTADSGSAERSIKNLKREIKGVTKEFESAEIGAEDFIEAASNLSGLQKELRDARREVVDIDGAYKKLSQTMAQFRSGMGARGAISSVASPVRGTAQQFGSPAYFDALNKDLERAIKEGRQLDTEIKRASESREQAIAQFRAGMGAKGAIPAVASPVRGGAAFPGSPAYLEEIARAAKQAQQALNNAAQTAGTIAPPAKAFEPFSLAAYETKLRTLKAEARLIAPDSSRWKELNGQILRAEQGIAKINQRQRLGPTGGQRLGAAGGAFLYGGGLGGGAASALGGIAGGLAGGVPGAFTGAALGQLTDNMGQALGATASYTAEIDKQRIALKNVTKDVDEYKSALGFIDRTSRDLAIPQDILNKQFTQISASVIGAGGNVDAAKEAFLGIAAGIRGTGGSLADMQGALLATAQVFSKGKVSAEELRQQIGERLPGAFALFAKSMGKTPQELDKMLEQGQVTLNDFMGFVRLLSSEYGVSYREMVASSQAAGDRLATTMSRMREAVGRELQPLGAQFQGILEQAVADNEKNLVALAKGFSEAAQAIGSFIEKYGDLIGSLGSAALLFGGTILAAKGLAAAFAAIGAAIPAATAAIAGYGGVVGTLKLAIAGLGGPITLTIASLVLLGKGVYDTNETFRNFVSNIGGVVASDFRNAVNGMADDADVATNRIQKAYEDLSVKLQPIGESIRNLFKNVFKDASDEAEKSAGLSSNAFNDFFNSLTSNATAAFGGLGAIINNWWSSLPGPVRSHFSGAVPALVGGARYAVDASGRAAAPNAQATGMYGRYGRPEDQVDFSGTTASASTFPRGEGTGAGAGAGAGGAKAFNAYDASRLKFLQLEASLEKQSLQRKLDENLISKTQFDIELANLEARQAIAQVDENLRLQRLSIAKENLSEQDKIAKLNDTEIEAEKEKAVARAKHFNDIVAIEKALSGPILEATNKTLLKLKSRRCSQRGFWAVIKAYRLSSKRNWKCEKISRTWMKTELSCSKRTLI